MNPPNVDWDQYHNAMKGKRETVICGKVSPELIYRCKKMIDGDNLKTINDVVEESLINYTWKYEQRRRDGALNLDSDAPHHQLGDAIASSSELIVLPQDLRVKRKDDYEIIH